MRVELCCKAVANALAPDSPILSLQRSRVVRVGSFEQSRERDSSSLEEEKDAPIVKESLLGISIVQEEQKRRTISYYYEKSKRPTQQIDVRILVSIRRTWGQKDKRREVHLIIPVF